MKISQRLAKIIQDFFQLGLGLWKIPLLHPAFCILVRDFDLSKKSLILTRDFTFLVLIL